MPPDTETPSVRQAAERAYLEGRRDAEIDGRLNSHERRLNAINGSIDRATLAHQELELTVRKQGEQLVAKIDGVAATLETRVAVEADRAANMKAAAEKQVSKRAFWSGVSVIAVMLIGDILAKVHL